MDDTQTLDLFTPGDGDDAAGHVAGYALDAFLGDPLSAAELAESVREAVHALA